MALTNEKWNWQNVGGCFVLAIKHEFVAFVHDKLDWIFCELDQGQWKPGNTSLYGTLCSWNHWCIYRYYVGRAMVLSFVHHLTILDITVSYVKPVSCSSVRWAKSLFLHSSHDSFGFPYANHIHCIFALGKIPNEFDLLRISLAGLALRNMITWRCFWK